MTRKGIIELVEHYHDIIRDEFNTFIEYLKIPIAPPQFATDDDDLIHHTGFLLNLYESYKDEFDKVDKYILNPDLFIKKDVLIDKLCYFYNMAYDNLRWVRYNPCRDNKYRLKLTNKSKQACNIICNCCNGAKEILEFNLNINDISNFVPKYNKKFESTRGI